MSVLRIEFRKDAAKFIEQLDPATQKRVREKIAAIASDWQNPANSLPLAGNRQRKARVGKYRLLLLIEADVLLVTHADSRGQIYRNL